MGESRRWCFLTLKPGNEPLKALVEAFLDTWQIDAGDPTRIKRRNEWLEMLLDVNGKTALALPTDELVPLIRTALDLELQDGTAFRREDAQDRLDDGGLTNARSGFVRGFPMR